jgi:WD40 repeat protein
MNETLEMKAVWGGDRARPRLAKLHLLMGSDSEVMYALGERDGCIVLETWSALSGVRISTVTVARGAQLRCTRIVRATRPNDVIIAWRTLDTSILATLDLETGSLWNEQHPLPYNRVVCDASRDGAQYALREHDSLARQRTLLYEIRSTEFVLNRHATSRCGKFTASWTEHENRLSIQRYADNVIGETTEGLAHWHLPEMAFDEPCEKLWCAQEGEVRCYAIPSMTVLGCWTGDISAAQIVAVSVSGDAVLLDGPVVFCLDSSKSRAPGAHAWVAHLARCSFDGKRLADPWATLGWYDLSNGERHELHHGGHAGTVYAIAVSRDGRTVATSSADRSIRVCDAVTGETRWVLEGSIAGAGCMAFSPDGRTLHATTRGENCRLTTWNLDDGIEMTPRPWVGGCCTRLTVSPDGHYLSLAGEVHTVVAATYESAHTDFRDQYTPDWTPIAGFSLEGSNVYHALVEQVHGPVCLEISNWNDDTVTSEPLPTETRELLAVSPSAKRVLCSLDASSPLRVYFKNVNFEHFLTFDAHVALPLIACTMGERFVACVGTDGDLTVRSLQDGTMARALGELRTKVTALAFSPDESVLYVGTENGQVRVYSVS